MAVRKNGYARRAPDDDNDDMLALFETVMAEIPAPDVDPDGEFKMLVSNIDWSDYVGRIAIGKIISGSANIGAQVWRLRSDHKPQRAKISKVFEYTALATKEIEVGIAGNIVGLSGFEDVEIGETIAADQEAEALPFVDHRSADCSDVFCGERWSFCRP